MKFSIFVEENKYNFTYHVRIYNGKALSVDREFKNWTEVAWYLVQFLSKKRR